jgi:hypothetical protein
VISGKLLIRCGVVKEGGTGAKDKEKYETLQIQEWSTEESAVVAWPVVFEERKDEDWFVRVLYGHDYTHVWCVVRFF